MSALARSGDLAASLGEMAEEQHHLPGVWDAGMLAATFLGLRAPPLPRAELWDGNRGDAWIWGPLSPDLLSSCCLPRGGQWRRGVGRQHPQLGKCVESRHRQGTLKPQSYVWAAPGCVFVTETQGQLLGKYHTLLEGL